MKTSSVPFLRVALAAAALTACASTVHVNDTFRSYPQIAPSAMPGAPQTGLFYARYVGDSEHPDTFWGGTVTLDQSLMVLDAGIEARAAGTEPYYRLHLNPRAVEPSVIQGWDEWFLVEMKPVAGNGTPITLPARLPADRAPDENGLIITDWTYCSTCIANFTPAELQLYRSLPSAPVNIGEYGEVRFGSLSVKPDAFGQAAIDAAGAAYAQRENARLAAEEEDRRARAKAAEDDRLYGAARREYAALKEDFRAASLSTSREASCGTLDLEDPPHPRDAYPADYEDIADDNAEAFKRHVECVVGMLAEIDYRAYEEQLDRLNEAEALVWQSANLPEGRRLTALSLDAELQAQEDYLDRIEQRFTDNQENLEYAYEDWFDYQAEQEELAREAWIDEQTDICVMGLAAAGNLTPYSQGYCRGMAENGFSGSDAAMSNNSLALQQRGRRPSRSRADASGGAGEFDIQGMMDNARAAANGDMGALWDESGAVRTTRAPGVAVGGGTSRPGRPDRPGRRPRAGDEADPSIDSATRMDSGETDDGAQAATASADMSAPAQEDRFPSRHYVTYVIDKGMIGGSIQNFFGAQVTIPGTPATGRIGRLEPFVTSDLTCGADGQMQADLRHLVSVIWDNASRQEVAAMEARAAADPLVTVTPERMAGPRPQAFENTRNAIGGTYGGKRVFWMTSHRFADQARETGCETILWNGDFENRI